MAQSKSEYPDVVISRGASPKECVLNGINKLGGISKLIKDGDQVYIKFNLTLPQGFPSNTNMDTLEVVIESCLNAGARKIYIGSFPFNGITINAISDLMGLKEYFLKIGAELVFLDNSDYYYKKNLDQKHLKIIKNRNFSKEILNGREFIFPKLILESDKYISVNQVNVDPIFNLRLSLLNLYSATINSYHNTIINTNNLKEYSSLILDIFKLKTPDLVINDLFYVLEGAGPFIYKDSNLKKTGLMVFGVDAIPADLITLKILNTNSILYDETIYNSISQTDISRINLIGENIDDVKIDIIKCVSDLNDINLLNFSIKVGEMSLGDFEQAYHLLNFLKTNMIKDIKYLSKTSFLIGKNPPEPESYDNIILFGNSAIKTTKLKKNIKILKIPGDPPDFIESLIPIVKFFGKGDVPIANFFKKMNESYLNKKTKQQLKIWEGL